MVQEIGHVLGFQATTRIATSALPCTPVLPEPKRASSRSRAAC
jgi:hypothetical protein